MTSTTGVPPAGSNAFRILKQFGPLLFLFALMLVFAVTNEAFLTQLNLFNVARQISITGLIALGMTFVILTAGIDLSVGSLLAFCGMVAAVVAKERPPTPCRSARRRRRAGAGPWRCSQPSWSGSPRGSSRACSSPSSACPRSW
jgi:ribose/xylose/arabinose/galactoside ABC-type transport system permease subunit